MSATQFPAEQYLSDGQSAFVAHCMHTFGTIEVLQSVPEAQSELTLHALRHTLLEHLLVAETLAQSASAVHCTQRPGDVLWSQIGALASVQASEFEQLFDATQA
jgi:hypothetical protein